MGRAPVFCLLSFQYLLWEMRDLFRGESQGESKKGRKAVKCGRERYGKNSGETKACVSLGYYLVSLRHTRQKPQ